MKLMKTKSIYLISLFLILLIVSGCGSTGTSTVKANQFGNTQKDTSLLAIAKEKYGGLGVKGGSPRILDPLLTTSVVDFLPADRVFAYNKDTKQLYLWFVYDNFNNGDSGTVTWKYLDTNEVVATDKIVLTSTADANYGRYNANILAPDNGWPTGKYQAIISVRDVTATADFKIISGSTVKKDFDLGDASILNVPEETKTETSAISKTTTTTTTPHEEPKTTDLKYCSTDSDCACGLAKSSKTCAVGTLSSLVPDSSCEYYCHYNDNGKYEKLYCRPDKICELVKIAERPTETKPTTPTTATTTTSTADSSLTVQKCYDDNYRQRVEDANKYNTQAMTWDSYWATLGDVDECMAKFEQCTDAIHKELYETYPAPLPIGMVGGDPSNPGLKLEVEMDRLCYNREVACADLTYKQKCGMTNQVLKTYPNLDEGYCNSQYDAIVNTFKEYNVLKNVDNLLPMGKIESCTKTYKSCTDSAYRTLSDCRSAAINYDYTACDSTYKNNLLNCVATEIGCHAGYYKQNCHTISTTNFP